MMTRSQFKTKLVSLIVILTFLFSSQSLAMNYDFENNKYRISSNSALGSQETKNHNFEDQNKPGIFIKKDYTPVESVSGLGNDLTVTDELSVYHPLTLSLDDSNGRSDAYSITSVPSYNADSLNYNVSISANRDFYPVRITGNKESFELYSGRTRLAQSFTVPWDYAVFYGAELKLGVTGATLGSDQIELYLVKANGSGEPNMLDVRSFCSDAPFNDSNPPTLDIMTFFDFFDVVIEGGKYYLVVELTIIDDNNDEFFWWNHQGDSISDSYEYNGFSWSLLPTPPAKDLPLSPELMQSDAIGNPKIYSPFTC
jgi:hypothetical protein